MKLIRPFVVFAVPVFIVASQLEAATLTLTPTVIGRFDDNLAPLAFDPIAGAPVTSGAGYYEIDFSFSIDGLTSGERGFANTLFDVNLTGGLRDTLGLGWNANSVPLHINGAGFGRTSSLYMVNQDAGGDALDLHRIIASIAPHIDVSDPRAHLGKDAPAKLGSVLVHWDGTTYSALSTNDITFSVADAQGVFAVVPGKAAGAVIEFGNPETEA